jgi:hypothetical protein
MNKKVLIGIIVAVVAIVAIVWIVMAVNSNNQNGGNGGGPNTGLNEGSEITDTSVEGEQIEGSSLVVTKLEQTRARGAKATVVNAGDTVQNRMATATFYDADGNEIATGSFSVAALEPGATKQATLLIGDTAWAEYDSVKYEVSEQ